ncbi:MAG: OsmC family peroxiredoxin [Proteobacteria bacterium]|nr:MAG: OsmC family peroxiredoxin [Pseudomonadota bacterium]
MESNATATWSGNLKDGRGTFSASSGTFKDQPFTFATRFEGSKGTNPEEMIAAAHASCFSMALSAELGKSQITPDSIQTSATVVLSKQDTGFAGADRDKIEAAAAGAKENCPISKVLNAKISLNVTIKT